MLGQHRYGAVDQIYRCGARLGLAVYYGVGAHVVGDVGDVYAHLPVAVGETAYRQCVVKVLGVGGVDGKCGDVAHVAALGYLFGRDAGVDAVGGALHGGGVLVGQAVLGQDGVHLGVVLAVLAQDIDHLAARVARVVGPVGDAHYGLVAGGAALELGLGDEDVGGQIFGVGIERGKVLVDPQGADECLFLFLDNLRDDCLGFATLDTGGDGDADAVAVESVQGVALGHENRLAVVVGDHAVLAVAQAHEGARGGDGVDGCLVLAGGHLEYVAVKCQLGQVQGYRALLRRARCAYAGRYLAVVERLVALGGYELVDCRVHGGLVG